MNRFIVLVPRKSDDESLSSLIMAKQIARHIGATPVIFHVSARHTPAHQLQSTLGLVDDSMAGCILESVRADDVASAVIRRAQDPAVRFVVLTGSANQPELGPITAQILASGCCPTLVVKPEAGRAADDVPGAASDVARKHSIRRILVPLDSSPAAAEAIRPALELATIENAQIDILHIATGSVAVQQMGALPLGRYVDQPHHELRTWSSEFLNRFYHRVRGDWSGTVPRVHLAAGDAAEQIMNFAKRNSVDLIVSAWSGKMERNRGRVVRELLREAKCSLLFVGCGKPAAIEPERLRPAAAAGLR